MKKLIIFDLDGTLLNTIADLAASVNHSLKQSGYPEHPENAYYMFVGNGITKLIERALPENKRSKEIIESVRSLFLSHYDENNTVFSTPYPGIPELLTMLKDAGYLLAVASNKYQKATEKLVTHYFGDIDFAAVFGQRDDVPVKPHPQVIEDIIKLTGITDKSEILYIGDSNVDMHTASNAGVEACGVIWGFRSHEELASCNPSYIVDKAEEIMKIISGT